MITIFFYYFLIATFHCPGGHYGSQLLGWTFGLPFRAHRYYGILQLSTYQGGLPLQVRILLRSLKIRDLIYN